MTLRRLRWLFLPLLAAAALLVIVLPPRPLPRDFVLVANLLGFGADRGWGDPQWEHRRALLRARSRLRDLIAARAHGAADLRASHGARALRSTAEPLLVVVRDGDVPEAVARQWLSSAEHDLGFFPRTSGAGVPVIVALHTRNPWPGSEVAGSYAYVARLQYANGAERACIVDIVFPLKGEAGRGRFGVSGWLKADVVGRCGFYARFGLPGPGVGRWAGLDARWTREWGWSGDERWMQPPRGAPDTVPWRPQYGEVPWVTLSCLRGVAANCEEIAGVAASSRWRATDPFDTFSAWSGAGPRRILASLLALRGPEGFARFWASPAPPDSALRAAYGAPAGEILSSAIANRVVPAPLAQPHAAAFAVAFGWVLVLAAVAMGLSWRREMDA